MKHIFLFVLLIAAAALPARADLMEVVASPNPVAVGSTFTVVVRVLDLQSGDELVAFGMNPFISDPSKAMFLDATVDSAFEDDSGFFGGNPAIAGSALPFIDSAPVTLATLSFRALAIGPVNIGVQSDLSDPNQGLLLLSGVEDLTASTAVNVATPEPGSLVLLSSIVALAALGVQRRRR